MRVISNCLIIRRFLLGQQQGLTSSSELTLDISVELFLKLPYGSVLFALAVEIRLYKMALAFKIRRMIILLEIDQFAHVLSSNFRQPDTNLPSLRRHTGMRFNQEVILCIFPSDIIIVPGANTGAVIFTNADHGYDLAKPFGRKLIEVLFDGKSKAANQIVISAEATSLYTSKMREELTIPADPDIVTNLASEYQNDLLGPVSIVKGGSQPVLDTGG